MPHLFIRFSFLAIVVFLSSFHKSGSESVNTGFSSLETDQAFFLYLVERLATTESVLQRTLSLLTASKSIPFSAIQELLETDETIKSFLLPSNKAEQDSNEGMKLSSPPKLRWKRQLSLATNSSDDRLGAALRLAKSLNLQRMPIDSATLQVSSSSSQPTVRSSTTLNNEVYFKNHSQINDLGVSVNTTAPSTSMGSPSGAENVTAHNGTALKFEDQVVTQKNLKETISTLQNAVKCSLGQPSDSNEKEFLGVPTEYSPTVTENRKLNIQFQMKTCLKYWTGLWVNVSEKGSTRDFTDSSATATMTSFFRVPKECLRKKGLQYSIEFPSNFSSKCTFQLPPLKECKVYQVEIRATFLELLGTSSSQEVVVLPLATSDKTKIELLNAEASSNFLSAEWLISSVDCAALLTSAHLKISEDGIYTDEMTTSYSYTIPRYCIGSVEIEDELMFYTSLYYKNTSQKTTPQCLYNNWQPLDNCRKYRIDMTPEYASLYKGNASSIEVFTSSNTDSNCCHLLTEKTGTVDWGQPVNFGCSWLISAKKGQQIWFTLSPNNGYGISCSYGKLKVFDGPYDTSPLLLEYCDRKEEFSVRSRSNKLYIKLVPNNYRYETFWFSGHYMVIDAMISPFISGCGGYIVDTGSIFKPSYPPNDESSSVCFFYIRNTDINGTLSITSNHGKVEFPMMVYADWSGFEGDEERLLYSTELKNSTELNQKLVVYSSNEKMLVVFPGWNTAERGRDFSWSVRKHAAGCRYILTSDSGTIESPNYPNAYQHWTDCKWLINTGPGTKVRLTLVTVDLVGDYDYLTIYDGLAITNSGLLKEVTGKLSKPITITSSTNELLVRLTTVDKLNYSMRRHGFLGAYSVVSCNN